jgi:hypothetical protein
MDKGQLLNAREMVLEALDARFSSDTPADIKLQIQALPSQAVFSFDPASGIDDPLEKRLEQKLGAGFLVLEQFQPVMISWPLPERCPSPEHRFRRVPATPARSPAWQNRVNATFKAACSPYSPNIFNPFSDRSSSFRQSTRASMKVVLPVCRGACITKYFF